VNIRLLLWVGWLAPAVVLSADAEPDAAAPRQSDTNACTWFSSIDDWQRLDDSNLIVWVPGSEAYHVELSMPLFDLHSADAIAFIDHNRDGRLCGFGMDQVVVPHAPIFASSTIAGMTRLDEAGLARLAEQYRLKLGKRAPKPITRQEHGADDR
jgi:hypothetical protein